MEEYCADAVNLYSSITGTTKIKEVTTPFVPDGSITEQDDETRGELSDRCCSVLMKARWLALARAPSATRRDQTNRGPCDPHPEVEPRRRQTPLPPHLLFEWFARLPVARLRTRRRQQPMARTLRRRRFLRRDARHKINQWRIPHPPGTKHVVPTLVGIEASKLHESLHYRSRDCIPCHRSLFRGFAFNVSMGFIVAKAGAAQDLRR